MAQELPIGDLAARQRYIARSGWLAIPATVTAAAIGYVTLPVPDGMDTAGARVLFALRWLPVAILPYIATCLTIMGARFYGGAHDPLQGSESARLRIHCRVMQNTLEQLAWFGVCLLAVAAQRSPAGPENG